MEIVLVLAMGFVCIACFMVGAKVGQTVAKGEKVEIPSIDPLKAYREHQARKEADAEQEKYDILMQNIENYDGTTNGQKEVPRGVR